MMDSFCASNRTIPSFSWKRLRVFCRALAPSTSPRCAMKISAALLLGVALGAAGLAGCDMAIRQDMADQPKNRPLSPSEFFTDGRSARHGAFDQRPRIGGQRRV